MEDTDRGDYPYEHQGRSDVNIIFDGVFGSVSVVFIQPGGKIFHAIVVIFFVFRLVVSVFVMGMMSVVLFWSHIELILVVSTFPRWPHLILIWLERVDSRIRVLKFFHIIFHHSVIFFSKFLELVNRFFKSFLELVLVIIAEDIIHVIPIWTPVIIFGFNMEVFLSKSGIWVALGEVVSVDEAIELTNGPILAIDDADEDKHPDAIGEFFDKIG